MSKTTEPILNNDRVKCFVEPLDGNDLVWFHVTSKDHSWTLSEAFTPEEASRIAAHLLNCTVEIDLRKTRRLVSDASLGDSGAQVEDQLHRRAEVLAKFQQPT